MAVVSAVVLGIENAGTQTPSDQRVAVAIAAGYSLTVLAFAVATVVGWRLLSHERISTGDKVHVGPG